MAVMTDLPRVDIEAVADEFRASRRRQRQRLVVGWIVLSVALLAAWELASRTVSSTFWVSSPGLVGARLWEMFTEESRIWGDIAVTLGETFIGFAIGAFLGLATGLLLGVYPRVMALLSPLVVALYALPKITLGPLLILYFGIGFEMKVALAAIIAYFLIFFNTVDAVRHTDPELIGVVRVAGGGSWDMLRIVLLPSALDGILTGVKVALPYSLQGALFGEILASNQGLGYLISAAGSQFDVTGVFAGLAIVTVVAVAVDQILNQVVRHTQVWRVTSFR